MAREVTLSSPIRLVGSVVWKVREIRGWLNAGSRDRATWEAMKVASARNRPTADGVKKQRVESRQAIPTRCTGLPHPFGLMSKDGTPPS
jgi:hypothetical protein